MSAPQIIGSPGTGLEGSPSWAKNADVARIGAEGERKTGAILNDLCARVGGPTVLHDVLIPNNGPYTANVDHIVVSGRTVVLIDSKVWKPGFLWTLGGTTRRGLTKFPAADKQTMALARARISAFLHSYGIDHRFAQPVVVVWPSTQRATVHMWAAQFPGARLVSPAALARTLKRFRRSADPRIVSALATLVVHAHPTETTPRVPASTFDF